MSSEKKYKLLDGNASPGSYRSFEKKISDAFRRFTKNAPFGTKISEYLDYRETLLKSQIAAFEKESRHLDLPKFSTVKPVDLPPPPPTKKPEPLPIHYPFVDEFKEVTAESEPAAVVASPAPKTNRRWVFIPAVALVMVELWKWALPQKALEAKTDLPYTHVIGPVIMENTIYLADWFRSNLYVHKFVKGLPIVAVENIPNELITGFAVTPDNLWTIEGASGRILQHAMTPEHLVLHTFLTPGKKPRGLYFDGKDLWSGDEALKTLYQHNGTDANLVQNEFLFSDIALASFQIQDDRAWIMDRTAKKITVLTLTSPMAIQDQYDLSAVLEGAEPRGFALREKEFLLTTENPAQIVRVSIK